jgi:hypothetical protein
MKISIVYFEENLKNDRKHHNVNNSLLKNWQYFYKKSKTKFEPYLLLDKKTKLPNIWEYNYKIIQDDTPPNNFDVLNKVGWIKSQSFDQLGKCIVMDCDAIILNCLDHLEEINSPMAMAHDPSERTYDNWKEVGVELNAGFMIFNSNLIIEEFKKIWKNKFNFFGNITYFDELIFSAINYKLNGLDLGNEYNASWEIGNNKEMFDQYYNKKNKILHFHGKRKDQIEEFLKNILNIF